MKLNCTFFLISIGMFLLLMGLIALVRFNLARASSQIPETVYDCLPQATQTAKLWGQRETEDGHYYLIGAFEQGETPNETTYQDILIYLNAQERCRSLLPQDDPVLSHAIPLQLARDLALQRYTRVLKEQGGRDAYQQHLTTYLHAAPDGIRSKYPPEYIWALEQLDIELPPDRYEVLR